MPLMFVSIALAGALTRGSVSQDDMPPARFSGRIIDEASAPVAGAQVLLVPDPRRPMARPPVQAVSDQDGRYAFARVVPGRYRVEAQKPGFVRPGDPVRVTLASGQTLDGVNVFLLRDGAIAGRIFDPAGRPLAEVRVMAPSRLHVRGGADRFVPAGQGFGTSERGEFRITGLLPGSYYVSAAPRMRTALETVEPSGTAQIATFYPGTRDASTARTVTVASGQTVADVEFRLELAAAFVVSGIAIDDDGRPAAGVHVEITEEPRGAGAMPGTIGVTRTDEDGRFEVGNVPSGAFLVIAMLPLAGGVDRGLQPGTSPSQVHIAVANGNLTYVRIGVQRHIR